MSVALTPSKYRTVKKITSMANPWLLKLQVALRRIVIILAKICLLDGLLPRSRDDASHLLDPKNNLDWNRRRWGSGRRWKATDRYGYCWDSAHQQMNSEPARIATRFLQPHLGQRLDLKIMELAPGVGRFTTELVRISREIHLVDMNRACIEICRERFKYYPNVHYYINDGQDLAEIPGADFDLIASFDAMVHMAPEIIETYVKDLSDRLNLKGLLFLDHSGRGRLQAGNRTNMTDEKMAKIGQQCGLAVVAQHFRNQHDCITVFRRES
jgi:SAM-dependent methyltransferase